MNRMIWAWMAMVFLATPTADARTSKHPRVLEPARYLAAPNGEAAWVYAEADRVVMSDGKQGVAAFDANTGKAVWSHSAFGGRLDQAWGSSGRVVLSGTGLEVLALKDGRMIWKRDTLCATGGTCNERVHDAGSDGVVISGQGRVHIQLQLHNLGRGKKVWKMPASVSHPRTVLARGRHLVSLDANAPFAVRFIDRRSGKVRGKWTMEVDGAPASPTGLRLLSDGSVVVVDTSVPSAAARVTFVDLRGMEEGAWTVGLPEGADTKPDWIEFVGRRIWVSGVDSNGERWIAQTRLGDGKPKLIVRGTNVDRPLRIDDRIVMHRHDEGDLLLTAWKGDDASHLWSRTMIAPVRRAKLLVVDDQTVLAILDDEPRALILFDATSGRLHAVGDLPKDVGEIDSAIFSANRLFLGVGKGVQVMKASPLMSVVHQVRADAAAGKLDEAAQRYERMALLTPEAVPARDAMATLTMLRLARISEHLTEGKRGITAGMTALADLFTMPRHDGATDLALLSRPITRILGFHVFTDSKVPSVASAKAIERIGKSFTALVARVGKHFGLGGMEQSREKALENATVVVAAALIRARRPALASKLLRAYSGLGKAPAPGQAALERRAAITALELLMDTWKKDLRDARLEVRKATMKHFQNFPFRKEALVDEAIFQTKLAKVGGEDAGLARRAGTEFINFLKRKVVRPANKELGPDLGEPACEAVCGALHAACADSCPDIEACDVAAAKCKKGCKRKLLWPKNVCE
jgi:hypothetical protein